MRSGFKTLACATGVLLLLATAGQAQQARRGRVHRMEINNGATQTVRYFSTRVSPGEGAALRDLERTENELLYVRGLQELKQQYVNDELVRENQRIFAQQQLTGALVTASSMGGYGTMGYLGTGYGFPYRDWGGSTYGYGLGGYGGYYGANPISMPGYAYGRGITAVAAGALAGSNYDVAVGDQGPIKDAMAQVIAQESTLKYAATVDRDYNRAVARASSSPTLRLALGLPRGGRANDYVLPTPAAASETPSASVQVKLKDGTTINGTKMEETKDWITIHTEAGRKVRVRPSEVTQIDEGKPKEGAVPAN